MSNSSQDRLLTLVQRLSEIGIALSAGHDEEHLLEQILIFAKDLTSSDAGTIYSLNEEGCLNFRILHTDSLELHRGGKHGAITDLPAIPLYQDTQPNHQSVVAHAVLEQKTIVIDDAYETEDFDFSGTRAFDARTGYRSKSMLTVPMSNHRGDVIGVLQLLNAQDESKQIISFNSFHVQVVEGLASQASIMMTNGLLARQVSELFESFVKLIATAIDEKSPYTGAHCRRVPELTMGLAEAAHAATSGPLASFSMSDDDRYELLIASWLHDCGKITTPEWIMDKATKLERIQDRIHEIRARCAVISQQIDNDALRRRVQGGDSERVEADRQQAQDELRDDLAFLEQANVGGEWMDDESIERIQRIAKRSWGDLMGAQHPLLTDDEVENLCIRKGTLLQSEREVINHHIVATIEMLEQLPFPKHLKNVPEIAGGHHERMDGAGYPKGLRKEQMSVQARCMGIADIFEALTASDRPYKKPMTVSSALTILGKMSLDHHIDDELFQVFVESRVWHEYSNAFLKPEQIDEVDVRTIPGYRIEP